MPFEPRLIEPDDAPQSADGELLLDDSLRQMAERLQAEANGLAAKYPFGSSAKPLELAAGADLPSAKVESTRAESAWNTRQQSGAPKQPIGTYLVGVAAGLIGLAVCVALVFQASWLASRTATRPASPLVSGESPRTMETDESDSASDPTPRDEPLELTPVIALPPLSSPELEGFIDLIEFENAGEPRVAI